MAEGGLSQAKRVTGGGGGRRRRFRKEEDVGPSTKRARRKRGKMQDRPKGCGRGRERVMCLCCQGSMGVFLALLLQG